MEVQNKSCKGGWREGGGVIHVGSELYESSGEGVGSCSIEWEVVALSGRL